MAKPLATHLLAFSVPHALLTCFVAEGRPEIKHHESGSGLLAALGPTPPVGARWGAVGPRTREGKARIAKAQLKHGRYVRWRERREKGKAYYKKIRLVMRQAREAGLIAESKNRKLGCLI